MTYTQVKIIISKRKFLNSNMIFKKNISAIISKDLESGTNYRIKVSAISSGEEDFSDSFAILQREIKINTPKKDKILIPHTNETIEWYSIGIYTDVRIYLCLNFTPILEITDNTENNYNYTWNVWQGDNYSNTTHSNSASLLQLQMKNLYKFNLLA